MSDIILEKASISKKKYKCPYCDHRNTRDKLIYHVSEKHEEMIPEGFTAARVVFNFVNHKEKGTCVCGCGRETDWNEDICRYERFTKDPTCKKRYIDEVNARKISKYGKWNLAEDPEFQEKMLAGRSISGIYKYSDGELRSYVGSFEKNLHEFLDKVMHFKSEHIESPGPIIKYKYNGEYHNYISDIYIIPYNLIIEVKDGGDNPNTREMKSYREKQVAKEAQIIKDGKYNYVRVTNNQFDQLFTILAELKLQLIDNYSNEEKIVRIYESELLMVHYKNSITLEEGLGISVDNCLQSIYTKDGIKSFDFLENCTYDLYKSRNHISFNKNANMDDNEIYKLFSGNDLYSFRQIQFDESLIKTKDIWTDIYNESVKISNYIRNGDLDYLEDMINKLGGY